MAFLVALAFGLFALLGGYTWSAVRDRERRLFEQAITDPLTGAFNRRHMDYCVSSAVARRDRTGEISSLLLIDVDHFKRINDTFGHATGDTVLKRLAALISARGRRLDVLFRMGGEEFVLLLPATRYAGALAVAEGLRANVAAAEWLPNGARISISIGVSELRRSQPAAAWIDDADRALYRAKQSGRNRVSASRELVLAPVRVM
jgi:diguanylate cyclase (GGDEF)-like protein